MVRSVAAAALAGCAMVGVARLERGSADFPLHRATDDISQGERQLRSDAFASMGAIALAPVPDRDLAHALASMKLPEPQQRMLVSAMAMGNAAATKATVSSAPVRRFGPAPAAAHLVKTAAPEPVRLAWLTLWDTDAEDGDVVRIESFGYARTVTLAKAPVTFAIPVPADGVVRIIGVRDGDGGGVTVGLGSGASRAVFPIMSVGQTLGLRVR